MPVLRPVSCRLASVALALASLTAGQTAHAAGTLAITAGYDYSAPLYVGNTFFEIANTSGSLLSGISFTAAGDGAAGQSDTATWTWSGLSVASGTTTRLYFGAAGTVVSGTGYGFTPDYQFTLAGNDQTYTFTGTVANTAYNLAFSPASNATGAFVAFLGNDASGNSLPANVSAVVGSVAVAVPEPATWLMVLVGAGALIVRRRLAWRA